MSKQIGVIILTDNVAELRGVLNRLEEVYNDITAVGEDFRVDQERPDSSTAGNEQSTATPGVGDAPGAQVKLDLDKLPWDARIHSSAVDQEGNHKMTAKRLWYKRKNVSSADVTKVEAELRAGKSDGSLFPMDTETIRPGIPGGPGIPGTQPPAKQVLPVPANISASTLQDCINITQVFAQMHGNDVIQHHLKEWSMTAVDQLPVNLYAPYVTYMVEQDAALA